MFSCGKDSTSLVGQWQGPCEEYPLVINDDPQSYTEVLSINSDKTLSYISEEFTNDDCTGSIIEKLQGSFSYIDFESRLDITVISESLAPTIASRVIEFNDIEKCGFLDWELNVFKNITTCEGGSPGDKGTVSYQIDENKLTVKLENGSTVTYTKK